jgi:glutamyl-Q tRNA(Asp) synthetase
MLSHPNLPYVGRFAPSPTGPLHAGSLVAALASWLDARAHGGQWLVRIEDVDTPRCVPGASQEILRQLAACGLLPDAAPVYQSQRNTLYQRALEQLITEGATYPCACSRKDIETAIHLHGGGKPRHGELIYPGTCRTGLHGKSARAWRFLTALCEVETSLKQVNGSSTAIDNIATIVNWHDRRLGNMQQDVAAQVGDFVLQRADGLWAYQLAVVVDDAAQGITHIVRGEDLADNTARQILLQRALGYATPSYLHTSLVLAPDGQKLSKQNAAQPLNTTNPVASLLDAATHLGLVVTNHTVGDLLATSVAQWPHTHNKI